MKEAQTGERSSLPTEITASVLRARETDNCLFLRTRGLKSIKRTLHEHLRMD